MTRLVGLLAVLALAFGASAQGDGRTVYVVNHSSVPDYRLRDALVSIQAAVDEDLGPVWNAYAQLEVVDYVPDDGWWIELVDDPEVFNALGYHGLAGNTPYAVVGARVGVGWTLVFTHELFELLVDPWVNRASYNVHCEWNNCYSNAFYAVEVADPVERQAYVRWSPWGRPVAVSDFVTPAWYTGQGGGPLDFMGLVRHHHQVMPGGYVYVSRDGTWSPIFVYRRHHV